jgi:hypothetical protein
MPAPAACGTVGPMTNLADLEERLMNAILTDHGVTATLAGLRGTRGGFVTMLPEVPRPGDKLTFAMKGRRGQGRYQVASVEWVVNRYSQVVIHLVPDETLPGEEIMPRSWG